MMAYRNERSITAWLFLFAAFAVSLSAQPAPRPDGLYAEIRTNKGLIVARLEPDYAPIGVANFVGLAEGTIANSAFDPGRPFYDGTVWHRVVPGHVIQTGAAQGGKTSSPGYTFPNELHAAMSHNHAGALNYANGGPGTNASQFCIMLGDRSYLDGDFTVFGDTVEGLDVVMKIVQGDKIESIKIVRVGAKAERYHPSTESFKALVQAAQEKAKAHLEKKAEAEREWIAKNYPNAAGPADGVRSERLAEGRPAAQAGATMRVLYRGREVRYVGDVEGRDGPPVEPVSFASTEAGLPAFLNSPRVFTYEPGKTKLNAGLDGVLATMQPGERRIVIVPAAKGYGRGGSYPPEVPGQRRFVVSPNALLVYEVEVLK